MLRWRAAVHGLTGLQMMNACDLVEAGRPGGQSLKRKSVRNRG